MGLGYPMGVIRYKNTLKSQGFHYLSSYNWKNEDVTTKSFNSNINENVFRNEVHRKIGWHSVTNVFGVPQGGNKIQNMLKL